MGCEKNNYRKEFIDTFQTLTGKYNRWTIWEDFVAMFACALSNSADAEHFGKREDMYQKIVEKYTEKEQEVFPSLVSFVINAYGENTEQDFLGSIFMELGLGNERNGQFFTPYCVSRMMSAMMLENIVEEVKDKGFVTISDPCCGAGALLIAGVNTAKDMLSAENMNFRNHVIVAAQDIDMTTALMCYIQLTILGVAGFVKIGDSLANPICEGDSHENYWFTPMYMEMMRAAR